MQRLRALALATLVVGGVVGTAQQPASGDQVVTQKGCTVRAHNVHLSSGTRTSVGFKADIDCPGSIQEVVFNLFLFWCPTRSTAPTGPEPTWQAQGCEIAYADSSQFPGPGFTQRQVYTPPNPPQGYYIGCVTYTIYDSQGPEYGQVIAQGTYWPGTGGVPFIG